MSSSRPLLGSSRPLLASCLAACVLLAVSVAPVGGSVVSAGSTGAGNAPSVDVAEATIDASSASSLDVSYNATGQVGSASDLMIVVETPSGTPVFTNGSLSNLAGTTQYTIDAAELSVNETLTARLYDSGGGSLVELANDSAAITVQSPRLTATAAANRTEVAVDGAVKFDGSGSALANDSSWDVRRNGNSILQTPVSATNYTHTFSNAGVYTGNLTASDGTGHSDYDEVTVVVGDSLDPIAALEAYPSTAAANETVQFYAGGSSDDVGIQQYQWDFDGDGTYEKTTTSSSPGGGVMVTHTYATAGTYAPTVNVTDYAGNNSTASTSLNVRPEPNVTSSSVTWTGNGTEPSGTIEANTTTGGGMFLFHLHRQGNPQAMDLTGTGADTTTELWVNFTVKNYDPDAVMGGANLHEWETGPNGNGPGTNFSARLQPVELQRNTSFTGMDPNQWKSKYDRANVGIGAGVYLGAFDMPSGKMESNMTGATLTSDAQAFMPPRFDQQTGQLNYSVAAPHWKKSLDGNGNKVQNTGFYEATIPSGMVSWMGIGNPDQLAGTYASNGTTTNLTSMEVVSRGNGDLYIDVSGIHYSSGTVSLSKDAQSPTADVADTSGTVGQSVTFDASGSADNRKVDTYEWDWDGDGTDDAATSSASASHTFSATGSHTVTLRVADGAGNTDTDTAVASIQSGGGGGGGDSDWTPTTTETAASTESVTATATAAPTDRPGTTAPSAAGAATERDAAVGTEEATTGPTSAADDTPAASSRTETAGQPGFGPLAVLLALLSVAVLARRRR